jgi:hypothetical protein
MGDEKPRDVRETLGELEGKLRDLEGELRDSAAGAGEPVGGTTGAGATPPGSAAGPGLGGGPRGRRPWIVAAVAGAVVLAAVLAIVLVSGGSSEEEPAPAEIALDRFADGSDIALAYGGLPGVRAARGDAGAEVCVGSAQAALVVERDDPDRIGCRGLQRVLTVTASARGAADPSRKRRCLNPSGVAAGASGASGGLTRARRQAQESAARKATRAADTPSPAAIRAGRVAAASASSQRRALRAAQPPHARLRHLPPGHPRDPARPARGRRVQGGQGPGRLPAQLAGRAGAGRRMGLPALTRWSPQPPVA